MSGIAGIHHLADRPVDRSILESMMQRIAHRGLNGSGLWTKGSIGLGHQLLQTTPESAPPQPLLSPDGQLCLTADARIDNREELQADLHAAGRPLRTDSDAELILQAYQTWGETCAGRFVGDFAFVIWDERRHELFAACDAVGIKPFYYHFDGTTFRWASEPGALFADPAIERRPNVRLISRYLLRRFDEAEQTLDADVYRLPGGHSLRIANGRLRKVRYWNIDPHRAIRHRSDDEYAEHFRAIFSEVVQQQLRSNGPAGAMLSGGLDSSAIVCTAQQMARQGRVQSGLQTWSLLYSDPTCDERTYIDAVVRQADVQANFVDGEQPGSELDFDGLRRYPDVFYFPTVLMSAPAFREAQDHGIRVMLDGVGGDDLLAASFAHLTDLFRQRRWVQLTRQLRADAAGFGHSMLGLFLNHCLRPMIPRPWKAMARWVSRPFRGSGFPTWLSDSCIQQLREEPVPLESAGGPRFPTLSQQNIYDQLVCGWNTTIALPSAERFAAHFGIEQRHPFFDRRIVEFLLAVPEEQRWDGPWPKAVLRRALRGILPESVRTRQTKAEFSCIVNREIADRQAGRLQELFRDSHLVRLGVLDASRFKEFVRTGLRLSPLSDEQVDWEVLIWLELWCRSTRLTEESNARTVQRAIVG